MRKEIDSLRAEVKHLRHELAELKTRTLLVLDDGRERFTREVILDLAKAILILGKANLVSDDYARIRKLTGA